MTPCEITTYSSTGHPLGSQIVLADTSTQGLTRVHREHLADAATCYATLEEGGRLAALYVASPWLPRSAVVQQHGRVHPGCWLTSRLELGSPGLGRAWIGPHLFLRRLDVGEADAWLAPLLLRLPPRIAVQRHDTPDVPVFSWVIEGNRYFYTARGVDFQLHGGGNTPTERLAQVLRASSPRSASEFLWSVGAVKLA